jgi:predicted RNase H-like HicB family nuclease
MTESEIRFVVTDDPDGGFDARAVGHAIFTQADTLDDLRENVRDAVRCHFEADERPSVIRLDVGAGETLAA